MSILIKGMDMPKSCSKCDLRVVAIGLDFQCALSDEMVDDYYSTRHKKCPLVEVPTPHGRLIDADEIKEYAEWHCQRFIEGDHAEVGLTVDQINSFVRNAPTIIEAEASE